jgi:hypothetical protein
MYLVRLIYCSRPAPELAQSKIDDILARSREKNVERGITGILLCAEDSFMQWVEGPREMINLLYGELMVDERHSGLMLLEYRPIHSRTFPDWSMARLDLNNIGSQIISRFVAERKFDPFLLSGDAAALFLQEAASEQGMTLGATGNLADC